MTKVNTLLVSPQNLQLIILSVLPDIFSAFNFFFFPPDFFLAELNDTLQWFYNFFLKPYLEMQK